MTAKDLKNSILQLAVEGKLVPQDPGDEPAAVLLKKIRAEKQKMVSEGKIKKEKHESQIIQRGDSYFEKVDGKEKCIDGEIPFEIPDTWEWVRLGQLLNVVSDGTHKTPAYTEKGIPFLSVQNVSSGKLDLTKIKYISNEEHQKLIERVHPQLNDILFCRIGTLGKAIKVTWDFQFSIFVSLGLLRPTIPQTADYIIFVINSPIGAKWIQENKVGGGTHTYKINLVDIPKMLIPLPPLAEQQRIVEKIEQLMPLVEEYGAKETELNKLQAAFPENLKKSVLQEAVQGKLVPQDPGDEPAAVLLKKIRAEKQKMATEGKIKKEKHESQIIRRGDSYFEKVDGKEKCIDDEIPFDIPENWEWIRLGDIGTWKSGATPSRQHPEYYSGSIPWLKTGDLNDGYIDYIPESISESAVRETSVKINPVGSVLIAMYGATIGKLGILDIEATTNQACCACMPFKGVFNEYLFYFLMSQKDNFVKQGAGGAQPNISKEKIVATLMPLPPLEEQQRIVSKIEEIMPQIDSLPA